MNPLRRFEGRTALVTGASRGIGAAVAKQLAAEGARVVLTARSGEALEAVREEIVAAGGRALAVAADATELDQLDVVVSRAVDQFGGVDVLVNNAGVLPTAVRSERTTQSAWEQVFQLNLTAPWHLANRCHQYMKVAGGGVVVNMISTAAFYPSVGWVGYNASKAALSAVTKTLALEWARDGIRVVGIAPGKIATDMVAPVLEWAERSGVAVNPLGRVGMPEEVAALVAFVASDAASYLTGVTVPLDGGELLSTGGS